MAIDDLSKKASELAAQAAKFAKENSAQIQETLKSEKAEEVTDTVLTGLADFANKVTGGKHADKITEVRNNLDGKIGNE